MEEKIKGQYTLSLLMSLKNSHCQNDVTLVFTIMLLAHGAGTRLVNMLNQIGVTIHWNTLMRFLDRCQVKECRITNKTCFRSTSYCIVR